MAVPLLQLPKYSIIGISTMTRYLLRHGLTKFSRLALNLFYKPSRPWTSYPSPSPFALWNSWDHGPVPPAPAEFNPLDLKSALPSAICATFLCPSFLFS